MNKDPYPEEGQYITIGYLRCLIDYLRLSGFPTAPVLQAINLSEHDFFDVDRRIPDEAEDTILLAAEELTKDPYIGLHSGQTMRPMHLGVLGHLLMTSQNSREWFELHLRYERLIGNGSIAEYALRDDAICLTLHRRGDKKPYTRQVMEYSLAGWISMARWLAGPDYCPVKIEFPHPVPANLSELLAFFRCELLFEQTAFRVYFPTAFLTTPLLQGDSTLRSTLETEATKRLNALRVKQIDADPQIAAIRQFVADRLPMGSPEITSAAEHIGLSIRSLQRKLDSQGTHYSELVDLVRQNLAEGYAKDQSLSLADIALMLGFSEQSAFQRAFRRWFNMPPGEFRRLR